VRRVLREERAHTYDTAAADELIREMKEENETHKKILKVISIQHYCEHLQTIQKRFEEMPEEEFTDDKLAHEVATEKVRHEEKLFKIRLASTRLSRSM